MADRIAVMNAGHIDQLDAPSEIYDRPATPVRGRLHRRDEPPRGHARARRRQPRLRRRRGALRDRPRRARGAGRRARADRRAARGGPRQHARRGRPRDLPDRDGARPPRADRRAARDGRRDRRPPAPRGRRAARGRRPRRQGLARLGPDRRAAARPRRRLRWTPPPRIPSKYRPDPRKERTHARPTRRAAHPCPRVPAPGRPAHGHPAPGADRRRRRGRGRVPGRLWWLDLDDSGGGGGGGGGGGEEEADKPPTPADAPVEQGDLLLANWVDYSAPANYKGYAKEVGPKVKVSGFGSNDEILAKLRAGGAKYDVISPTGYAVKTMADLGLIMPLTHELIPNLKNLSPAFTKTDYDPGNKYSVPKDYGITSFYWLTEKVSEKPATIAGVLRPAQDAEVQGPARQLPRGRHAGHGDRARRRSATRSTPRSRSEIDEAKQLLRRRQAERRHDQLDVHRAGHARRDRLRHGLERRHPARDRGAGEEGPRDDLPRARGQHGVLGRQLGHPGRRRAPRRRAQVDQLRARPRRRRAGR